MLLKLLVTLDELLEKLIAEELSGRLAALEELLVLLELSSALEELLVLLEEGLELPETLEELLVLLEVPTELTSALDELSGKLSEFIVSLEELPCSADENVTTLEREITGGAETFGFSLPGVQPVSNIKADKAAAIFLNVFPIFLQTFRERKTFTQLLYHNSLKMSSDKNTPEAASGVL